MKRDFDFGQARKALTVIAAGMILSCLTATAASDWGVWAFADGSYTLIPKKLKLDFGAQLRTMEDFKTLDKVKGTVGAEYKINAFFKAGAGYELIYSSHKDEFEFQNRGLAYAVGSVKAGRMDISLREQFQLTHINGVSATSSRINPKMYLRSRLKLSYDIPKCKFEPYASGEVYYFLNSSSDYSTRWTKIRLTAGVEWKISKTSTLDFFYRHVSAYDNDEDDYDPANVIGIGLGFSF